MRSEPRRKELNNRKERLGESCKTKISISKYRISNSCISLYSQEMFSVFFLSWRRNIYRRIMRMRASPSRLGASEIASEELRRLCLALMRFYTKIIQIRALDYVEVVYQATKKKRKLVGALCRVLDDWSRFASRRASRVEKMAN